MTNGKCAFVLPLPLAIRSTFARDIARSAVHVGDSSAALSRVRIVAGRNHPILIIGNRILRKLAHVAGRNQIVERLGQLALVCRVLIDERTHLEKIVVQNRLARVHDGLLKLRQRDRHQYDDDRDDDHQLEKGKARRQTAGSRRQENRTACFLPTASCLLFTTSHCTSLHSGLCHQTLSARQKHFRRPIALNPQGHNKSGTPNRLSRSLDRLGCYADRFWSSGWVIGLHQQCLYYREARRRPATPPASPTATR